MTIDNDVDLRFHSSIEFRNQKQIIQEHFIERKYLVRSLKRVLEMFKVLTIVLKTLF